MKHSINHPVYGVISYEENIWTGKKSIRIGDTALKKGSNKQTFLWENNGEMQTVTIHGSFLSGVSLNIGEDPIELLSKTTWYEYLLAAIPLLLDIVWGNSVALCSIVPLIGGAIGGAIGGVAMVTAIAQMRGRSFGGKLLTALIATVATFAVCAVLGYLLVFAYLAAT